MQQIANKQKKSTSADNHCHQLGYVNCLHVWLLYKWKNPSELYFLLFKYNEHFLNNCVL